MIKLLRKYIKPFVVGILIVVGLLYVQAQSELALPDYMSKIVTNGIQAGGFDNAVLEVCSKDTYDLIEFFLDDDQKDFVEESYEYQTVEQMDEALLKKFPDIQEGAYVLKEKANQDQLVTLLTKPLLLVTAIRSSNQITSQIPEGMRLIDALQFMPKAQIEQIKTQMDEQMETLGDSSMQIAACNVVKSEYESLGANLDSIQNHYIIHAGIKMLSVALLGALASIVVGFFSARIGAGFAKNLRKDVFSKVQQFSTKEFNNFSTASLITRTTNDVQQIQNVITMCLRVIVYAPIIGIGALLKVLENASSMTWIIGVVLVVLLIVIIVTFSIALPKFSLIQKLIDRLNLVMRENLSGMLVIRAFGNEKVAEERFDKANQDTMKINLFVNRLMSTVMPIMMFIMNGVSLLIVWFGAKQIDLGNLAIGDMMAFLQYSMQIIMAFVMIAMIFVMIPRASVAAKRVNEVLEKDLSIQDPVKPQRFDDQLKGLVEFRDVSFSYPEAKEEVLSHITFTTKPGQTTAFIGSTGSGKSTLVSLVNRFYDVTSGEILIDGVNIKEVTQKDLRKKIGLVPQVGVLFSGTIGSNIAYGNDAMTKEEMDEVCQIAQASEFIESKEEGYASLIAQGGTNVSGGQKQRLAIARALAKKPEIYVFDDSFSALDFKTDAALRKALNERVSQTQSTVLLVGQRIASIMHADQIIVLDEGKMVGIGTHEQLMENCKVYQEIAMSQLSKEELNHE